MEKSHQLLLKGTAYWAHTDRPEMYQGNALGYSIMVKLDSEEATEKLKNHLEEIFNEAEGELATKVNRKYPVNLGVKEDTKYGECFKARTKHEFKDKTTGELIKRKLHVFKANGEPLEAGTKIGNGSKVQVKVYAEPYAMSSKNYGITLRLLAVKVDNLVEYNSAKTAEDYGFDMDVEGADTFEDSEEVEF